MWNKIFNTQTKSIDTKKSAGNSAGNKEKNKTSLGNKGERAAEQFLKKQGLYLIERNYRCQRGELDLIMQDEKYCVFVEVRLRKNAAFGSPAETITHSKQQKLIAAAQHYLLAKGLSDKALCRFDVVSITGNLKHTESNAQIEWHKNAFTA